MEYKRVVVTGSLAYDHIMSMPVRFRDYIMPDKIHMLNVSFIMDKFRKEFGGTGGNQAYSLARLGVPNLLVAAAGNDFGAYKSHQQEVPGLDTSGVVEFGDVPTAQGFVMTDRDDNQIWGFYEGAMAKAREVTLKQHFTEGDMLIVAPNDPEAMVNCVREAVEAGVDFVYDPAFNIPRIAPDQLAFAVKNCKILIGNDYEIELLRRSLKMPDDEFFDMDRIVVTTFGSEGSKIRQGNSETGVGAVKVTNVVDPTGAGDAYRSGFAAGYVKGKDLETCGQMGAVSAAYAVENYGTQSYKYTADEFNARYNEAFGS